MSWPIKKLRECLMQFDRGISWSRKDEGGTVAVLRIPNIEEGHINLDDLKYIDPKNRNGELDENDIVMVASNGNPDLVGRSALVTGKEEGMRFASFLVRLRFDNTKLLSHYAHLFLLTPIFKRELRRKIATTSGIYNLRKEHVEKIKIPVPPLATQKQIVERLDKIAEAQKLNDDLIKKADELFQSLLHKELNPTGKDWEIKKLENLLDLCDAGVWGKPTKENGILVLRSTNFKNGGLLDFSKVPELKIDEKKRTKAKLKDGDILLEKSGGGPDQPVGRVVYYIAPDQQDYTFANFIQRLRAISSVVNSNFLFYHLLRLHNIGYTKKLQSQTTGIRNLKLSLYLKTEISLPPMETQKQIVAKLSAVQDYKTQLLAQKAKLKELFNSVLAKSFQHS